uniref:Uncharacterized protein n=1 Tax=Avena sativa TaxID=4498 RepID=A0ACD5UTX1_AVESA
MEGGWRWSLHSPALARIHERLQAMLLLHTAGFLGDSSDSIISRYLRKWPEVDSPCFWTSTFALIQLVFITSIMAQFLFKRIRRCGQRLKTATPESNKHSNLEQKNADIKLGVSYQASKVCCLLILLSHVMRISFLQLRGRISGCKYPPFVLGEGLQVLSWIILSLTVFSLQKTKSAKHQLTIRAWWIFNFLQSIISVIIDLRFSLADHEYIGYAELIDLFTLVAGTYLFAISVRGKTGITLINSSIAEPLLTPSTGHQTERKRASLYGRASVLDLVTFSWMSPLFAIGYKKPLDNNDVPDIDGKDYADLLSDSFKRIIADVECRHGISTLSIYRAMLLFISREATINATFAILCACASYVGPSLINDLVKFLGGKREYGLEKGYLLAVAFLSAKVVETVAQRLWIFGARKLGMRLRAALISHIYQKGLRLSCSARQKHTSGEIINYMSVDIQRITDVIWYMNYIWMLPIQLSLAVYVLHQNLGAGAWVALAATLAVMACNIPLTRLQKRLQSKIMTAKDNRMKATTEVLRSMKILKLQAWDTEYLQKLEALRRDEHNWLWKSVMQDGKIVQKGTFDDLLQQNIGFEAIVGAHSQAIESVVNAESSSRILSTDSTDLAHSDDEFEKENDTDDQLQGIIKQESGHDVWQGVNEKGRLTQDEERERGGIGKKVYWAYLTAVHGGALAPVIVAAQSFFQIFQVASNYWMAWACPPTSATTPRVGLGLLFFVYIALSIGSALCVLGRSTLVSLVGLLTAEKFFKNMLHCILRAPMSFFDSTPTGRILNRVSNDQTILDLQMANKLGWCAFSVIQILGTIGVMSQVAWPVFAIFIPVTAICYVCQRYYIPTARELARLSEIQRAPILHHFAESLTGAASIRAYGQKDRFSKANISLVNNHSRPWFHSTSAIEWLCFRLNMLSNFVFAFSLTLLVSLPEGFINPSIAGLAVTYALNLNGQLSNITWNICDAENKMISVERIMQYSRIPSEAPLIVDDHRPPNSWPKDGTINIRNLEVRYAEHLPSVLRNISCTIPGRKKVGIVGRTGSGKSTLIQALFRIVEPRVGTIEIDNVDLSKIGLHDLRGRLSIIPQDPTMFEGTVRGNLDPLNEYSDQHIWETLDKCQLGDIVRQSPRKLDSTVVENGENWSVGQRQLFCLGRVLLRRSNVLVLDEATASVDSSTDAIIQQTLREEFGDCTVLTVAHRIHTVIDSDLILVLSEGRIIEYDTPSRLLEDEKSEFSRLIKEYSRRSKDF